MTDKAKLYIRFGVHKEREVLQDTASFFNGVIIPAHILAYSPEPTVAAITYIDKDYIIDPMTYIYKYNFKGYVIEDKKSKTKHFKPSIDKLTKKYDLQDFFVKKDYEPMVPKEFDNTFIKNLIEKVFELETKIVNQIKSSSIDRYMELLQKVSPDFPVTINNTSYSPSLLSLPYFDFETHTDPWFNVNVNIYNYARENYEEDIVPILAFKKNALDNYKEILSPYKESGTVIYWIDGLDERKESKEILEKYKNFVEYAANELNINLINLYGGYFSILLSKFGLKGTCNGIYYGENKLLRTAIGGIPPSRYYIEEFHDFYPIPTAYTIIKDYPELLCNCDKVCKVFINKDKNKILEFDKNYNNAQKHFICVRNHEAEEVTTQTNKEIADKLIATHTKYADKLSAVPLAKLEYLKIWAEIVNPTS